MKKTTLLILTILLAAFSANAQYCASSGNGGNSVFIGQVCITLPNCLTPFGVNGDYTNNTGMGSVHTVTPTGPNGFVVGIERSNAGDYTYAFFIDLNGDMDFDDAGENFATGSGSIPFATGGAASINANPTIPVTATNGVTRVRFIAKSGTAPVTGPCETGYNGETEDFLFTISGASSMCADPTVPTVSVASPICPGTSTTLNISGTLNDATAWNVYSGSCGGTLVGTTTTGTFNVTPPAGTTTYFVRGEGGCVTPGSCGQVMVTSQDVTPPVITCPANVSVACDGSTAPASTGSATATDTCDAAPVITFTDAVVAGVGNDSVITRTWTATDANMNASSCDQVITVTDAMAPVITCPADLTVECDASTAPADTGMATATDNCDATPVITFTDVVVAGVGNNSVITRTWTATDANMNASSCDQVITVTDTMAPVFTNIGGDGTMASPFVSLDVNEIGGVPSGTYYFQFNGNVFQGELDNDTSGGGWLMVLNYVHQVATNPVLVVRNTDLPLMGASVLGSDESGTTSWGHLGNAMAADIDFEEMRFYGETTGHTRIIDFTTSYVNAINYVKTGSGSFNGINNPGNYTLDAGHTATIPASAPNEFSGQGDLALTNFPFWRSGQAHWGIRGNGNRWEVDDFAGTTTSTIHRIWVRGDLSPVTAIASTTITVELDAAGNATISTADFGITSTDNCGVVTDALSQTAFTCANLGENTIQYTITDENSNVASTDVIVNIVDVTMPIITCPADLTVECDASTAPTDTGMATATDNCDATPVITFTDVVVAGVGNNSVITRTWTATDANMNASSCDQVITVTDTTAPVITCPADLTVECDASTLPADTGMATATDNCDMAPVITFTDAVVAGVGSNSVITRTWTATDANMNASSCDQIITVTDTTPPVPMCAPAFTVQLDAMGMASITVADIENGSTDNCGMITTAIDVMDFTCADVGTPVTVTLTVTDENMNTATCTTVVTVEDMIPPVITCPADVVVPTDPAALIIVNPVSVTTTFPAQFGTDPVNTINGVGLTTFPSLDSDHAATTPPNSFVGSGTTGSFTFDLGSSQTIDRLSFWNQNTGGPTNTVGLNSVQLLSSTDGVAFTPVTGGPTVFALVTTGVSLPETFTFPAVTATHLRIEVLSNHGNGNTGFAEIAFGYDAPDLCTASNVDLGTPVTSDNCPNFVVTNDAPMIFPLGDTTVTWTITDASGNAVMCTQLVTVEDLTPVTVVSGPIDIFTGTGPSDGDCATTVDYGVIDINSFVIEDNCGDATTTTVVQTGGLGSGSSFPVGITVEEFTLTDSNGNITIYTFEVTITDTTAPTLACPGDLIVSDGGTGVYTIEDYTTTAADNCSSGADLVVTQDPVAGTEVAALSTTTVTVTATDAAGNVTECVFDILVDETLSVEDDVFNEASITVYPNPTNGELNILAGTTTIDKVEVYDLSGRLVKRVSFDSNTYQFNLSDVESAVYLVQVYSGSNVVTKRVVKN